MSIKKDLDEEKAVTAIVELWTTWKDARREKEEILNQCVTNYLVHIDESNFENWPWRCKVADTFSQETADTIGSALRNALFPVNEEFFEVIGDDELGLQYAGEFQKYLSTMLRKMKFIERLGPWCKQLAILGNAPMLGTWETMEVSQRRRVRVRDVNTGEPSFPIRDEKQKQYDGPGVQVLDFFDVVFDPSCLEKRKQTYIRRVLVEKDLLPSIYKDIPKETLAKLEDGEATGKPSEPSDLYKFGRAKVFGVTLPESSPKPTEDESKVEILELHGDCVVEGERHTELLAAVLNRKLLATFDRTAFWAGPALKMGTYDDLWFTPFGKGPLEPVRGTQQLIDTFSCQKADILNIITNGAFAYVDDGIIDPETLYLRPRAGIEVGNIGNIKELHPSTNVSLTYQEIEMLRSRGERSTGKSRFDMGQAPGGRRTAYEASLIRQGGGARDIDVVKHLANDVMEPLLEWIMITVQQMKWDSNELGPKTNEILLGQYHINYLGADLTAMRQFGMQQAMLFLDMTGRYPALAEATDAPNLVEEIAGLFNFKRKVVKDRAVYQREQAMKQQMAQMEMMQGGRQGMNGMGGPGVPAPVDEAEAGELAGVGE